MHDARVDSLEGEVHQGDRLRYRVVIKNSGDTVAEGVHYEGVLDELSALVSGSVSTTPIARNDSFVAFSGDQRLVRAPGVLANDNDPDGSGPALFVEGWEETSAASSTPNVSVDPDGGFRYDPPPSFVGTDTFRYHVSDGEGHIATARVEITVTSQAPPQIVYLDVTADTNDPRIIPCTSVDPCTIPTFTDFRVRFSATTDGRITGYTWQIDPPLWEPFGSVLDANFLALDRIEGDTLVYDIQGRRVWGVSERHDSVTVYLYSDRDEPIIPASNGFSGDFLMRARARDDVQLESDTQENGERLITVNYDPDTRLFSVPECDCPGRKSLPCTNRVPAGWVTGIGDVESLGTIDDWILFCQGDTIPNASVVRFYANGWDDARDLPIDPVATQLPETSFRFRFEMQAPGFSSRNMPFSSPAVPASDLLLPAHVGGGTFRGASAGWKVCPFDYRFFTSAMDEHQRIDGTPNEVQFVVGGSPVIDSLQVPAVVVFVPTCPNTHLRFCPDYHNVSFGPDTLAVFGVSQPDTIDPRFWQTTYGLGWNSFVLPFKAFGHDHPRDQNPDGGPNYYSPDDEGHIRSWQFSLDCIAPGCDDIVFPGEDVWRENDIRPGQGAADVFDDALAIVRIPLDTLCVADEGGGCSFNNARASLNDTRFGNYLFEIQGRDTEFVGQTCLQPTDLGENPGVFVIDISARGRTTAIVTRQTALRMLADVRPRPSHAGQQHAQQ